MNAPGPACMQAGTCCLPFVVLFSRACTAAWCCSRPAPHPAKQPLQQRLFESEIVKVNLYGCLLDCSTCHRRGSFPYNLKVMPSRTWLLGIVHGWWCTTHVSSGCIVACTALGCFQQLYRLPGRAIQVVRFVVLAYTAVGALPASQAPGMLLENTKGACNMPCSNTLLLLLLEGLASAN